MYVPKCPSKMCIYITHEKNKVKDSQILKKIKYMVLFSKILGHLGAYGCNAYYVWFLLGPST